jgi:hypothetical protein
LKRLRFLLIFNGRLVKPPIDHSREDVRALDIDGVEIHKAFRPGDIVRASVVRAWKPMWLLVLFSSELDVCLCARIVM